MNKGTAILMAGNLGAYKFAIDSILKNAVEPNNADVFILASRGGYIHVADENFKGSTFPVQVGKEDEEIISSCFKDSLKFSGYIEDVPGYDKRMAGEVKSLQKRTSWINDDPNKLVTPYYNKGSKRFIDPVKYLDQYLRLQYLIGILDDYELKNSMKYDRIVRLRIDQILDRKLIVDDEPVGQEQFHWLMMDNLYYGTPKIMKHICHNFAGQVGGLRTDASYIRAMDFRLTQDPQFREFISNALDAHQACLHHIGWNIGWRFFKKDAFVSIPRYSESERDRKSKSLMAEEYYEFTECEPCHHYPNFDTEKDIVCVYYMY